VSSSLVKPLVILKSRSMFQIRSPTFITSSTVYQNLLPQSFVQLLPVHRWQMSGRGRSRKSPQQRLDPGISLSTELFHRNQVVQLLRNAKNLRCGHITTHMTASSVVGSIVESHSLQCPGVISAISCFLQVMESSGWPYLLAKR